MKSITAISLAYLLATGLLAQNIFIDGNFADWNDITTLHNDNSGDQGLSGIDFGSLKVFNDPDFLYFTINLGKEINLQDNNEVELWIDTDNNPASGVSFNGIGADFIYSFGNRMGTVHFSGTNTVYHNDIGLVTAPTVSSDQFELVIRRNTNIAGQALFQADTIKVLLRDNFFSGDLLPDNQGGVEYTFQDVLPSILAPYSIAKSQPDHLRILSYNVLFNGLFEFPRSQSISRLVQAIQPEIISFQEIYDYSSFQVRNQVESILPSSAGESWYHADAGPDVHTISRFPILETYTIDGNGAFLLDLTEKYGTKLLLIGVHFPCCDNNSGRQKEIDAIMAFIRAGKDGTGSIQLSENTPIVILGDMNLVGEAQQVKSLLEGDIVNEAVYGNDFDPDWDGTTFEDAHPFTTGLPMSFTWFDEGSSFNPGRLDYVIYSGSVLELMNSYALFTRALPQDSLTAYNLFTEDAVFGSDHLPVVTDFQLNSSTPVGFIPRQEQSLTLDIFPNPANGPIQTRIFMPRGENAKLSICAIDGTEIQVFLEDFKSSGWHTTLFNPSRFPAGLYLIKLSTNESTTIQKVVIE